MCGSTVDIQSPTAEIRQGKQKKKIEITDQKYNGLPYYTAPNSDFSTEPRPIPTAPPSLAAKFFSQVRFV